MVNDDAQLIDAALAGQSVAFGNLVTKYQDRLYNALVHVVGSADDAQDIAQDAFVQAFLKLKSFQRCSAFYTWLYRIAFNLAISRLRKTKPVVSIEQVREMSGEEIAGRDPSPSQRFEQHERAAQVRSALAALDPNHRAILVLREIDGCHYEAIAEILDVPLGTVRSRLHRARMELRELLKAVVEPELDTRARAAGK
jgi:RNA polymerase sigma-70 factor, ECF subfamily